MVYRIIRVVLNHVFMMVFKDSFNPIVGCLSVVLFSVLYVFHSAAEFFMSEPVFDDVCIICSVFMFFLDESCYCAPVSHVVAAEIWEDLFSFFAESVSEMGFGEGFSTWL